MEKAYEVSWKMTGTMMISAIDGETAREILDNIEDVEEILKHSIGIDCESTGASHDIFDR